MGIDFIEHDSYCRDSRRKTNDDSLWGRQRILSLQHPLGGRDGMPLNSMECGFFSVHLWQVPIRVLLASAAAGLGS